MSARRAEESRGGEEQPSDSRGLRGSTFRTLLVELVWSRSWVASKMLKRWNMATLVNSNRNLLTELNLFMLTRILI